MKKLILAAFFFLLLPFSVQAYEVSTLTLTPLGSSNLLRVGETSEIGRFRITNEGRKTLSLETLSLRNYGTARLDESFEFIGLYHYAELVGSSVSIERKSVNFRFNETFIRPGDSLILSVKGRLLYGRYNKTIQLGLNRKEDIGAKEITTGFYADCEDCRSTKFKVYRLRSGNVTISRQSYYRPARYYGSRQNYSQQSRQSSYTPSLRYQYTSSGYRPTYRNSIPDKYNAGAKGVTFLSSSISSNTGLSVDGLFLAVGSGSQASDKDGNGRANERSDFEETFKNFKLYVNGYEEASASGFDEENGQIGIYFSSGFDLPPQNQILVVGRVDNQAVNGDRLSLVLNRSSLIDPTYLTNRNIIDRGDINGSTQTRPTQKNTSSGYNFYQAD